jgi:L-2-hydroxyglutarate oxidase LhgO
LTLEHGTRYDIVIVGAGLVGLATAWQLIRRRPALRLAVIEKEAGLAAHQSGHSSGVLHSGIYYRPGSLRARLCIEGKREMEEFAARHGVALRRCGKLVVAVEKRELAPLAALAQRARENGVEGVDEIGPERIREIEPAVLGLRALYVPGTSVIGFRDVARALAREIVELGGQILPGRGVTAIMDGPGGVLVETTGGEIHARALIACAGLHSDRLAAMTGHRGDVRILPIRGDYYTLSPRVAARVRALVYPVPIPAYPFLGVHFTRTIHDEVHAGPNAVFALSREGYRRRDVTPRDVVEMISFPGFLRMAAAHAGTGLGEVWRAGSRRAFASALRRYIPDLADHDLTLGPTGVRAQAIDRHGRFLDDFDFAGTGRVLHVRNAPSPAATAALAIGRHLAMEAEKRFELPADASRRP